MSPSRKMTDEHWAKAIIIEVTGQASTPSSMLKSMIADIRDMPRGRPIADLPDDNTSVLARTEDGRVMIWRASILHNTLRNRDKLPNNLQFPATQWMPISDIVW